jgi:hypothetical protein
VSNEELRELKKALKPQKRNNVEIEAGYQDEDKVALVYTRIQIKIHDGWLMCQNVVALS